ncbi:MAG: hypothetical protein A6F71_03850 [Cycloclasticus sp. symbiont of Poecilosclerida sp. M]|nr:MAG: hypothetical protein A6F71_03850 [Cycloclasticus sp. symbiont of Poecilosclerida sp. M]
MPIKEILSSIAIALTLYAFFPYIRSILKGEVKPHVFSWIIWGSTTLIVFFAQLAGGAGVGAWPIGVSGLITIYVALLAFIKRGDIKITRTDWFFFLSAMSSLPFWCLTSDPLWAVVILTSVDILGLAPTVRKAYEEPFQESVSFFAIIVVRNAVAIMALELYSLTTVLFPAAVMVFCIILVAVIVVRRRALT